MILESKETCEESLIDFVRQAWHTVDSTTFQESWAIEALCLHLEAVSDERIRKLLVNFPPRCSKTKVTSVLWPVWVWIRRKRGYLAGPHVEFLCGSYGQRLSEENANDSRQLIASPWFQERWGAQILIRKDQNMKANFANTEGGARISSSVGGTLLGIGGSIIAVDDPHNTQAVESEAERETVLRWWKEVRSTRLNDPKRSAIVVIMQRLHEEDVSGVILSGEDSDEWTHLMIPMEYDPGRHCQTSLGVIEEDGELIEEFWEDPRSEAGELMWPQRFGQKEVNGIKRDLGSYMASGRLQQSPVPSGGGIIKRDHWQLWDEVEARRNGVTPIQLFDKVTHQPMLDNYGEPMFAITYPPFEYVVASLDTAYTEKQENDPSALTIWGVWRNYAGQRRVMLCNAWAERLELNALVTKVGTTCQKFRVDRLLIEAKASGHSVAQEIRRLYNNEKWVVQLVDPGSGDKVARAYAVQGIFETGMIYAPDRVWASGVIDECATFPKGKHDDRVDSSTQALAHLRLIGMIELPKENLEEIDRDMRNWKSPKPLYDPVN